MNFPGNLIHGSKKFIIKDVKQGQNSLDKVNEKTLGVVIVTRNEIVKLGLDGRSKFVKL